MSLMRTCTKCFLQKPIEEFGWKDRTINKRHAVCKECTAKRSSKWYYENREHHLETVNNYTQSHRDIAREYVYQYLSTHPCEGILPDGEPCNETDPVVLEFHHVGEKIDDIAIMVGRGHSLEKIKAEIAKCQVLCKNCHARVTAKERGFFRFKKMS
jgi:hypothetical protein